MYYYNNKPLPLDRAFSDTEGNQYPANWLRSSTQEQRDALGITWVADTAIPYDQRFYWGPNNPKDLDGLKELWMTKERHKAYTLLQPTDWYITRMIEMPECTCPEEVKAERQEIRDRCNLQEYKITNCETVEALIEIVC